MWRCSTAIFARLRAGPQEKERLRRSSMRMDPETFDKALEKLWIHGGAMVDFAENVARGQDQWRDSYIAQGEQKRAQIDQMIRFAESNSAGCHALVRHFGDTSTGAKACGHLRFLRSRRLRGATIPNGDGDGAKRALPGAAYAALVSDEIDRQTAQRTLSEQRDEPRRVRRSSWERWRARDCSRSPMPFLRKTASRSPIAT